MIKLNLTKDIIVTNLEKDVIFDELEKDTEAQITYDPNNGKIEVNGNFMYRASLGDYYNDVMTSFLLEVETIPVTESTIDTKEVINEEESIFDDVAKPPIMPLLEKSQKRLPNLSIKYNLYNSETGQFLRTLKHFPNEIDILPDVTDEDVVNLDSTFTYIVKNDNNASYILKVVNEGEGNVKIKAGNILTLETL